MYRGDLPEPPPRGLENLGLAPGYQVRYFPDLQTLSDWCAQNGTSSHSEWNAHRIAGCTINGQHMVALLSPASKEEDSLWKTTQAQHEFTHTWGFDHGSGGRGWVNPTPAQTAYDLSVANPQQQATLRAYLPPQLLDQAKVAAALHYAPPLQNLPSASKPPSF